MIVLRWIWLAIKALIGYNLVFSPMFLLLLYSIRNAQETSQASVGTEVDADYGIIAVTAYEYTQQLPLWSARC